MHNLEAYNIEASIKSCFRDVFKRKWGRINLEIIKEKGKLPDLVT
tara:strand:+ start:261 stop:395 length:135 start_codon:yes stop_codon:yes gene_type:complete